MTHFPSSPVTATDEMVERAWAAMVGSDIAAQCHQASIIRADLKTALEAVLGHAQTPREAFVRELRSAPSLDENGYICTKDVAIRAFDRAALTDTSTVGNCK